MSFLNLKVSVEEVKTEVEKIIGKGLVVVRNSEAFCNESGIWGTIDYKEGLNYDIFDFVYDEETDTYNPVYYANSVVVDRDEMPVVSIYTSDLVDNEHYLLEGINNGTCYYYYNGASYQLDAESLRDKAVK